MIYVTVYMLLLCISVMLYRIVSKLSDIYDKVLAFNNFSTQAVLLITAMSIILNNFFLLDIALLYASISFVSTIALMRLMLL
ncbi:MAG: monovalent cation/H+ antiporter complex subunit F [Wolbachia sp.]